MRIRSFILCLIAALTAAVAARAETYKVRVGVHPDHTRVVVDWNAPFEISVNGPVWHLAIAKPGSLDISALNGGRPPLLLKAASLQTESGVALELTVGPDVGVATRRIDGKIVLDLSHHKAAKAKPEAKAEAKAEPKPEPKGKTKKPEVKAKTAPVAPPKPEPAIETPPPAVPVQPVVAAPIAPPPPAPPVAPPPVIAERLGVMVEGSGEAARLVFPWPQTVGAAAFARGEQIWLVFDRPSRLDLGALAPDRTPALLKAEQIAHPDATILRLTLRQRAQPAVLKRQAAWVLSLAAANTPPALPIAVEREVASPDGRVLLRAGDPGRAVTVTDPETGATLQVVPVGEVGRGVAEPRDFLEFQVLSSSQGVVVLAKAEGVQAQPTTVGVEVSTARGLLLARAPESGETKEAAKARRGGVFAYEALSGRPAEFAPAKQAMQQALVEAEPGKRDAARLALAGFYFANGMATDALAVLALIGKDDPAFPGRPEFRALRGAARVMAGRTAEAAKDLGHPSLDGRPEVALWRGLLAVAEGQPAQALQQFTFGEGAIQVFPAEMRVRFDLGRADAALATGDLALAERSLVEIDRERPQGIPAAEAALRRGRLAEADRKTDEAIGAYDQAIAAEWRPTRVRAEFAKAELQHATGKLDDKAFIDRLESMRFSWRGDRFEVEMRRRLAQARAEAGENREALAILRDLAQRQPKGSPVVASLDNEMRALFADVYLGPRADKVSPIQALALFEENRDLAPRDERAEQISRRLVDRLVEVDLLDRAMALLTAQAAGKPNGLGKARDLTRIAALQIIDRKPEEALATLKTSREQSDDAELTDERRLLEVQALVDLGRLPEALAQLDGVASTAAQQARADLLWRAERWPDAAAAALALLGNRNTEATPLEDGERRRLLQAAIAFARAGDQDGAQRLKRDWDAKMAGTADADAFRVLTESVDVTGVAFRQLAAQVAGIGELEGLMARYRGKPQGRS